MTKRDFELIASVLAHASVTPSARLSLAEDFADELATTNPRFDRERFIEAATR